MASTSPVCGFITTIAPRLRPARFRPHSRAFSASFCSFESMVRTSELPAIAGVSTPMTRTVRPVASFSTRCAPYVPRSSDS